MGEDSRPRGCGFESPYRMLDGHFSHTNIVVKNVCLKKPNLNDKRGQGRPLLKKIVETLTLSFAFNNFANMEAEESLSKNRYFILNPKNCRRPMSFLTLIHRLFDLVEKERDIDFGHYSFYVLFGLNIVLCSRAVWPDSAKFRHFGKSSQVFGKCLTVYFLFGKMLSILWQTWDISGLVFIATNGRILKNNFTIWSHCSRLVSWEKIFQ